MFDGMGRDIMSQEFVSPKSVPKLYTPNVVDKEKHFDELESQFASMMQAAKELDEILPTVKDAGQKCKDRILSQIKELTAEIKQEVTTTFPAKTKESCDALNNKINILLTCSEKLTDKSINSLAKDQVDTIKEAIIEKVVATREAAFHGYQDKLNNNEDSSARRDLVEKAVNLKRASQR